MKFRITMEIDCNDLRELPPADVADLHTHLVEQVEDVVNDYVDVSLDQGRVVSVEPIAP